MYIAERSGIRRALDYTQRLEDYCQSFSNFPYRGTLKNYIRPSMRTIGFEGRATIVFYVEPEKVFIDRVLYGGRELD